jgi:hypothetical protein
MPLKWFFYAWISARPSSLLGKQSKSGNIRSTFGQYWFIIKKNGTNYDNFVRNCVNYVGNFVGGGGGGGGGEVVRKNSLRKKFSSCLRWPP